jgi:plasmid stability protein
VKGCSLIVREIDALLEAQLRERAARHGRSFEEEVHAILRVALASESVSATEVRRHVRRTRRRRRQR